MNFDHPSFHCKRQWCNWSLNHQCPLILSTTWGAGFIFFKMFPSASSSPSLRTLRKYWKTLPAESCILHIQLFAHGSCIVALYAYSACPRAPVQARWKDPWKAGNLFLAPPRWTVVYFITPGARRLLFARFIISGPLLLIREWTERPWTMEDFPPGAPVAHDVIRCDVNHATRSSCIQHTLPLESWKLDHEGTANIKWGGHLIPFINHCTPLRVPRCANYIIVLRARKFPFWLLSAESINYSSNQQLKSCIRPREKGLFFSSPWPNVKAIKHHLSITDPFCEWSGAIKSGRERPQVKAEGKVNSQTLQLPPRPFSFCLPVKFDIFILEIGANETWWGPSRTE